MMNGLSSEGRKNISGIKIGNAPTAFGERGGNRKRLYNERVVIIFLPFVSFLCPSCPRLCLLPTFLCTRKDRKKFAILIRMVGQQQRRLKLRLKNRIRVFQIKIWAENYNGKKKNGHERFARVSFNRDSRSLFSPRIPSLLFSIPIPLPLRLIVLHIVQ